MARTLEDAIRDGDAYTWHYLSADIDAGDTLGLLKNTGNRMLHVHVIRITGGNAASLYTIHKQLAPDSATPAGTAVAGVAIGRKNNNLAATDAIAIADETGYAGLGTVIDEVGVGITSTLNVDMYDLVLKPNEAIAVDQETENTAGGMTIIGWFA